MVVRVKVMWDYHAFPVWLADRLEGGGSMLRERPIESRISAALRAELQTWSDEWTEAMWGLNGPDDPEWIAPPGELLDEWEARGELLAHHLARELGKDFLVGLFRESTGDVDWRC